jgi:alpha-amylase/alpha-mannosidase (GH57 family)
MHQPYYKNLLTQEVDLPWVRLHATKDYLDMVKILEKYPAIHLTFNLVPCLIEQIEDYTSRTVKDKYLELSYKPAKELSGQDKSFIQENFFFINKERVISLHPRYYELYLKKQAKKEFSSQDYLDLQVWFNLAWIDPVFRQSSLELKNIVNKARFFTEEEKQLVLARQIELLEDIIPTYKKFMQSRQIEISVSPYYHPILPLLYSTNTAKEANPKAVLPKVKFAYPQDCLAQIQEAVKFYQSKFGRKPAGMWPSEEAVSEHILPFLIDSGINWIIADEAILFKSRKLKKRNAKLLYQPYLLKRKEGDLNIIFRDRNLSDLIGFVYYAWKTEAAVQDFIGHLELIHNAAKAQDLLVTVAMDGENAWEYYTNDGADFLNLLYQRLSESKFIKTITVSEYLEKFSPQAEIKRLACGSWIYAEFGKWIGHPLKLRAWECLALARKELETHNLQLATHNLELAYKQIYIAEGSDWFWWYGDETNGDFDKLFRTHLLNFYALIAKDAPAYLNRPLTT